MLPVLVRYVPAWFPGAGFRRVAHHGYELAEKIFHEPFEHAKEMLVSAALHLPLTSFLSRQFEGKGRWSRVHHSTVA
jgi:hypothetical protein